MSIFEEKLHSALEPQPKFAKIRDAINRVPNWAKIIRAALLIVAGELHIDICPIQR
uniref:Uncharacterized protein n=1 Tax=Candidatus Kentrum sp. SD TaxID=2126332 RepID=A0A451BMB7_9GAMM|nr:MAG: hypothetical protein BECKSD772D_GA0070982_104918 [Candidatus Kentron sp. SD]